MKRKYRYDILAVFALLIAVYGCDSGAEPSVRNRAVKSRAPLRVEFRSEKTDGNLYSLKLKIVPLVRGREVTIRLALPEKAELVRGKERETAAYAEQITREYVVRYPALEKKNVLAGVTLIKGNMKLATTVSASVGTAAVEKAATGDTNVKKDRTGRKIIEFKKEHKER